MEDVEKVKRHRKRSKIETQPVNTLDVILFGIYKEAVNAKHKQGRFVIPLEFKTNLNGTTSLSAKLIKISEYNDEPSLETMRVSYTENYSFLRIDEEHDEEWLYVLSLENKYKEHIELRKKELEIKERKSLERKKRKEKRVASGDVKPRKKRITKKEKERQFLEKLKKRQQEQSEQSTN